MKINFGKTPLKSVDWSLFGAEASVQTSALGAGYSATAVLTGGKAAIFELQVGLGLSSEIGIIDDSIELKVLGTGCAFGRKVKCCFVDICVGMDIGKFFRP